MSEQVTPEQEALFREIIQANKKRLLRGLAVAGVGIVILFASLFVYLNVNESQKIASMHEIADGIKPGSDWKVIYSPEDPQSNIFCIPTDSNCYRLSRTWETLGLDSCMESDDPGRNKHIQLSVDPPSSFNKGYVISLLMYWS